MNTYTHPKDIWEKMHREAFRAYNSQDLIDIKDHIFNFCITAHSLRDWSIKHLNLSDKKAFHEQCNQYEVLQYCRDIANCTKHFKLDNGKSSTVKELGEIKAEYAQILPDGTVHSTSKKMTYDIIFEDTNPMDLIMFLFKTQNAWDEVFELKSIDKAGSTEKGNFAITYIFKSS